MVNSTKYTIHTKSNGKFSAEFNTQGPNTVTRGEGSSYIFQLKNLVVESGETITIESGDTESYQKVTVLSDSELIVNGTLNTSELIVDGTVTDNGTINVSGGTSGPFDTFRQYGDFAGSFVTNRMLDGTVKYRDQIPTSADVDSLVLGIEPSQELKNAGLIGVWGIVNSVSDERNVALSNKFYGLEMTVLAEFDEYSDHADMETNLQL